MSISKFFTTRPKSESKNECPKVRKNYLRLYFIFWAALNTVKLGWGRKRPRRISCSFPCSFSLLAYLVQKECVFTFCKRLSLPLGKQGTFALFKLSVLLGNCIKMNSITYLKFLIGVFNRTLSKHYLWMVPKRNHL